MFENNSRKTLSQRIVNGEDALRVGKKGKYAKRTGKQNKAVFFLFLGASLYSAKDESEQKNTAQN